MCAYAAAAHLCAKLCRRRPRVSHEPPHSFPCRSACELAARTGRASPIARVNTKHASRNTTRSRSDELRSRLVRLPFRDCDENVNGEAERADCTCPREELRYARHSAESSVQEESPLQNQPLHWTTGRVDREAQRSRTQSGETS